MNSDRARLYLLSLSHVVETLQWGGLLFWVGDKAIGGKMCAIVSLEDLSDGGLGGVISYPAGPERFAELVEMEGIDPARYLARAHWVSAQRWDVFRKSEWETELGAAYALTLGKLPPKTRGVLELSKAELKAAVLAGRKTLAMREAAKRAKS